MMKTLHRRCAGLDVHSDSVVACARLTVRTKATHEVRRFSTTTRDLLELADWASFVPPTQIQEVRDLTRTRTQLGREVGQHIQRIQKTLENANIKLTSVISNIMGTSGRRILKAIIRGETNPANLAELGSPGVKCPPNQIGGRSPRG